MFGTRDPAGSSPAVLLTLAGTILGERASGLHSQDVCPDKAEGPPRSPCQEVP